MTVACRRELNYGFPSTHGLYWHEQSPLASEKFARFVTVRCNASSAAQGGEVINGQMPSFRNGYEVLDQRSHKYDINSNFHGTPCQHHNDTCAEYSCLLNLKILADVEILASRYSSSSWTT